jgi:hypothetical protein
MSGRVTNYHRGQHWHSDRLLVLSLLSISVLRGFRPVLSSRIRAHRWKAAYRLEALSGEPAVQAATSWWTLESHSLYSLGFKHKV